MGWKKVAGIVFTPAALSSTRGPLRRIIPYFVMERRIGSKLTSASPGCFITSSERRARGSRTWGSSRGNASTHRQGLLRAAQHASLLAAARVCGYRHNALIRVN